MNPKTPLKRLGILAALAIGLVGAARAADGLTASSVEVSAGALPTAVTVDVSLDVSSDLSHLGFRMAYDPALLSVTAADITPVAAHFVNGGEHNVIVSVDGSVGDIVWSVSDYSGGAVVGAGAGPLVTIQFTALAALSYQTAAVDVYSVSAWDTVLNPVSITPGSGGVSGLVPVTISSSTASPTSANPIPFTITFDDDVTGFSSSDLVVTNGSASGFTAVSASEYTVNISPGIDGTVSLTVPEGSAQHAVTGNGNTQASLSRIHDGTAPGVVIASSESDPTNNSPFSVTITFDEAVTGFTLSDILVGNGTAGNLTEVTAGTVWTASITPAADGDVTVDIGADAAQDAAGNGNTAALQFSITYDASKPSVLIGSGADDPTNASPFMVTISFDKDVTGFVLSDIVVGNGAASNLAETVANRTWTASITPAADGQVTVDIPADAAYDDAGNGNSAALQFSRVYDGSAPGVVIASSESDPTNASPFAVTITFDEDVTGFTAADVAVTNAAVASVTETVANRTWTASLSPAADGTVTVDVAAGAAEDTAGNASTAALPFSIEYDGTAPGVTITSGESDPTNASPFVVTVAFDEAVTGFGVSDLTVGNGSAANLIQVSANRTWTAEITPVSDGLVTVDIAAGVAADAAGNANTAAGQFSITYDSSGPVTTVASSAAPSTSAVVIPFTVSFGEAVIGFEQSDVVVTNGSIVAFVEETAGLAYSLTVKATAPGAVTVEVPADAATDEAGNGNLADSAVVTFAPTLDVDGDGYTNFRDIVFCARYLNGHPTVDNGVTLPEGETAATVEARIQMLMTVGDSGFAPLDVDMDGSVDAPRDIVFIYRQLFGHQTVPEGVTLPDGVTADDVAAAIDALLF